MTTRTFPFAHAAALPLSAADGVAAPRHATIVPRRSVRAMRFIETLLVEAQERDRHALHQTPHGRRSARSNAARVSHTPRTARNAPHGVRTRARALKKGPGL